MKFERLYYRVISTEREFYHFPMYLILKVISGFYFWGHCFRLWAYRFGLFPTHKLDCRVISVGNLTLGGTGKTPVVMMIAETLRGNGHKPGILTRGYGGNSKKEVNVVCDGKNVLLSPEVAGDEAVMMAERLKNVPILTGSDRYQTGRYAIEHFGVDTIILDDGFQHLGLKRDTNILLFDHQRPFGNGQLFPAGELREPKREARRADLVCVTRYSGSNYPPGIGEQVSKGMPIVKSTLRLDSLLKLDSNEVLEAKNLRGQPVAAFCGIANPEDFRRILEQIRARVVDYHPFPDHHEYTSADLRAIEETARRVGAKYILTTEKDAVKLNPNSFSLPAYKVSLDMEILEGREVFNRHVLN
jgi:tetraacyldisaccharide 4'-kinase